MEATPNLSAVHSPSKATHSSSEAIRQEALTRAISGQTMSNYPAIYQGFIAKGIPESEILPRENVFTFNAWRALGRYVVASMASKCSRSSNLLARKRIRILASAR